MERSPGDAASGAPALVFLHHFGGAGRTWSEVVALLSPRYRCVAPDLRGFGDSKAPPGDGYAVDDYADDIAARIREEGVERYVLVGHSMGGKIALALAARRPAGLESLVLIAPSPPTPEPMEEAERARLRESHGSRSEAVKTVRKITARRLSPPLLARTVEDTVCASQVAWRAWLDGGSRENLAARMPAVMVPVRVVAGESDPVVPPDLLERAVVRRLENAAMTIVPGAGHLLPLEAPGAVAEPIRAICDAFVTLS